MTRRMDAVAINYWLRIVLGVLDAIILAVMIYDVLFAPGSVNRRDILWQTFGVISLTAGLAYASLHRPTVPNAHGVSRSGAEPQSN